MWRGWVHEFLDVIYTVVAKLLGRFVLGRMNPRGSRSSKAITHACRAARRRPLASPVADPRFEILTASSASRSSPVNRGTVGNAGLLAIFLRRDLVAIFSIAPDRRATKGDAAAASASATWSSRDKSHSHGMHSLKRPISLPLHDLVDYDIGLGSRQEGRCGSPRPPSSSVQRAAHSASELDSQRFQLPILLGRLDNTCRQSRGWRSGSY